MHSAIFKGILLGLATCSLMACQQDTGKSQSSEHIPMVKTLVVAKGGETGVREYPGRVLPDQKVDLAFQVSGLITTFSVVEGQVVKQGDVLATLRRDNFQSQYEESLARFTRAEKDFARAGQLLKSGTIAQAMYDDKKEAVDVALAQMNLAKINLSDTQLVAPFSGIIARTYVENHQEVQAKQPILNLQDVNTVNIQINVPERDLAMIKREDIQHDKILKHKVVFEGLSAKDYTVSLKEYATEADPITQTYRVTLSMPAPEDLLILPGVNATMRVDMRQLSQGAVEVPAQAVWIDADGKANVWRLNQELRVAKTPVKLGQVVGHNVIVREGLSVGDEIVVAGVSQLSNGMTVRLFSTFMEQE